METGGLPVMLPSYMKIMLHALHRLKNDALRVIELSIYHPSFFIFINSKRVMKIVV